MMVVCQAEQSEVPTRSVQAPAKLNLTLRVHGRRSDGFHQLESFVIPLDLCDEIHFRPAHGESSVLECETSGIPVDAENLVCRALAELHARRGGAGLWSAWRIRLVKQIPVGAGLGGGSSDAAAALRTVNDLNGLGLSCTDLLDCAARIGSDVPFFLYDSPAVVRGRGERVSPADAPWNGVFLLILPGFGCSTRRVFEAFRLKRNGPQPPVDPFLDDPADNADELSGRLFNDLREPAFQVYPQLSRICLQVQEALGCTLHLSGSGSTLYCPVNTEPAAAAMAESVRRRFGLNTRITRLRFNQTARGVLQ